MKKVEISKVEMNAEEMKQHLCEVCQEGWKTRQRLIELERKVKILEDIVNKINEESEGNNE